VLEADERAEARGDVGLGSRIAARENDDRYGLGVGLGDAAEGVLGAGAVLVGEDADAVAGVVPGPYWLAKTPMRSPELMREKASAMWMPVRSWRTMIGRMSMSAPASSTGWTG
jgi:hypothetical protein